MSTIENEINGSQVEGALNAEENEDEDAPVQADAQGRVAVKLSTGDVEVTFFTTVPQSLEDAASDTFYGSQEAALKALQRDWTTRKKNSVRPGLADAAKQGIDLTTFAQQTADAYRPGRRGGFTVQVAEDEIRNAGSVDEVIAMLRAKGVQFS